MTKITGQCEFEAERHAGQWKRCHRRAQVELECVVCGDKILGCQYHRERLYGELQQHILRDHPEEYQQVEEFHLELEEAKRSGKHWQNPDEFIRDVKVGKLVEAMRTGPIWLRIMLWLVLSQRAPAPVPAKDLQPNPDEV